MYVKKTVEEALSFIRLKIKNRVKLITNGSQDFTGREFIIEARNIVGSNFICLVFSRHRYHCDWILQTENVLYTSKIDMFEKFSLLKMDKKSLLGFIDELEKAEDLNFNINEDQMLYFPHADVPPYTCFTFVTENSTFVTEIFTFLTEIFIFETEIFTFVTENMKFS
ncbi:hypothetical protein M9Y10_032690 [Tritrichomonas musculus]|uniref:Uncharacterized protein n=1 Tax=Tritrichomonas musculus TaxID=1915356 RepID=A0ABR2GXK4_9EUKA